MRHEARYWASQLPNQGSWWISGGVAAAAVDDAAGLHVTKSCQSAAAAADVGCGGVDVGDAAAAVDCCCDGGGGVCH